MSTESSGKPDAWKLARPGWGQGAIPRPTPRADGASCCPVELPMVAMRNSTAYTTRRWRESMPLPDRDVPNGNGRGPRPIGGAVLGRGSRANLMIPQRGVSLRCVTGTD